MPPNRTSQPTLDGPSKYLEAPAARPKILAPGVMLYPEHGARRGNVGDCWLWLCWASRSCQLPSWLQTAFKGQETWICCRRGADYPISGCGRPIPRFWLGAQEDGISTIAVWGSSLDLRETENKTIGDVIAVLQDGNPHENLSGTAEQTNSKNSTYWCNIALLLIISGYYLELVCGNIAFDNYWLEFEFIWCKLRIQQPSIRYLVFLVSFPHLAAPN